LRHLIVRSLTFGRHHEASQAAGLPRFVSIGCFSENVIAALLRGAAPHAGMVLGPVTTGNSLMVLPTRTAEPERNARNDP